MTKNMLLDYKNDIYFDPRLGEIYARLEGGRFREFNYETAAGHIRHQFIMRPIELADTLSDSSDLSAAALETYSDLTTPYGYGGPLIMEFEPGRKQELLAGFAQAFADTAVNSGQVVRFHILPNAADFSLFTKQNTTTQNQSNDYDDPFQASSPSPPTKSLALLRMVWPRD